MSPGSPRTRTRPHARRRARALRVLHVLAPGPIGDIERLVLNGVTALRAGGLDARLLAIRETRAPHREDAFRQAARQLALPYSHVPSSWVLDLTLARQIRHRITELAPDVVHAHGYKALAACLAAAGGLRAAAPPPVVATSHGTADQDRRARLPEAVERRLLRRCARVFAVSQDTRADLLARGLSSDRVHSVPSFVPWPTLERTGPVGSPPAGAPLRLVTVGRLSRAQALDVLLEAVRKTPDVSCAVHVIGDGPKRASLERAAEGLEVTFTGFADDHSPHLLAAHAFALPSRREALPLALLEAAASGLPIVASRVGAVSAVVAEGHNGLLAPPADVDAWSRALRSLSEDHRGFARRAHQARGPLEARFGPGRWASTIHAYYRTTLSAAAAHATENQPCPAARPTRSPYRPAWLRPARPTPSTGSSSATTGAPTLRRRSTSSTPSPDRTV